MRIMACLKLRLDDDRKKKENFAGSVMKSQTYLEVLDLLALGNSRAKMSDGDHSPKSSVLQNGGRSSCL